MPVSEWGAVPEPFAVDKCPYPERHLPTRVCGECKWVPWMHPDFVPRYDNEVGLREKWLAEQENR
jgi:hypothetical protein